MPRCGQSAKNTARNRPRNRTGQKACPTESGDRLGLGLGLLGGAAFLVLLLKSFDASRGVHQLLLACVEGMAVGADFHADVALVRGAGLECVATSADDVELVVSGMNTGLHL